MLRIAVPNKGSLSEPAVEMLKEAGYRQRRDSRELVLPDPDNDVEFFFLRPRDIAVYVGAGTVDVGITGRDLMLDSESAAVEHLPLGFARSTFRFAGTAGEWTDVKQVGDRRVATSYPVLVRSYLRSLGIEPAGVVRLDGAVESAIKLGVADVIADVVETGSTLRAAGLATFGEVILDSQAVLITRGGEVPDDFEIFRRRIEGVLVARSFVMMDYDIEERHLERASELAPGREGPTISPLGKPGWVAVRVMVPRAGSQRLMDDLYSTGARAILLTDIHACRL